MFYYKLFRLFKKKERSDADLCIVIRLDEETMSFSILQMHFYQIPFL